MSHPNSFDLKQCRAAISCESALLDLGKIAKRFRAGLAVLLIASGCEPAFADAESDSRPSWDAVVSVHACTEIIDGSAYGSELRAEAFRRRGNARAAAGAHEEAIRDFDSAVKLRPDDAAVYAARGQVRLSRGDNQGAVADWLPRCGLILARRNISSRGARGPCRFQRCARSRSQERKRAEQSRPCIPDKGRPRSRDHLCIRGQGIDQKF